MSYGYYRFFPGDYMRDTMHLGWLEDLAYRRLIDLYCLHGKPIKNDRQYIMRAVRASEPEQQTAVDTVLADFFQLKSDGWHQTRCNAELRHRAGSSASGKAGAKARWNKQIDATAMPSQCGAIANQNQNQNQNHKTKERKPLSGLQANHDAAKRILEFLNSTAGKRFRETAVNLSFITARLLDGLTEESLRKIVVRKCRDWLPDEKMRQFLRPQTLFNRTNCESYFGNLVPPSEEKITI